MVLLYSLKGIILYRGSYHIPYMNTSLFSPLIRCLIESHELLRMFLFFDHENVCCDADYNLQQSRMPINEKIASSYWKPVKNARHSLWEPVIHESIRISHMHSYCLPIGDVRMNSRMTGENEKKPYIDEKHLVVNHHRARGKKLYSKLPHWMRQDSQTALEKKVNIRIRIVIKNNSIIIIVCDHTIRIDIVYKFCFQLSHNKRKVFSIWKCSLAKRTYNAYVYFDRDLKSALKEGWTQSVSFCENSYTMLIVSSKNDNQGGGLVTLIVGHWTMYRNQWALTTYCFKQLLHWRLTN